MPTLSNIFTALTQRRADSSFFETFLQNKLKSAIAAASLALAASIAIANHPAPLRTNADIIRVVSNNDVASVIAKINKDPSQLRGVDLDGNTPLHLAARGGYAEMVDALISAGADVNLPNRAGWTPLTSALLSHEKNQAEVIKALLAAGANTNIATADGQTVQQLAIALPGVDSNVIRLLEQKPAAEARTTGGQGATAYATIAVGRQ